MTPNTKAACANPSIQASPHCWIIPCAWQPYCLACRMSRWPHVWGKPLDFVSVLMYWPKVELFPSSPGPSLCTDLWVEVWWWRTWLVRRRSALHQHQGQPYLFPQHSVCQLHNLRPTTWTRHHQPTHLCWYHGFVARRRAKSPILVCSRHSHLSCVCASMWGHSIPFLTANPDECPLCPLVWPWHELSFRMEQKMAASTAVFQLPQ